MFFMPVSAIFTKSIDFKLYKNISNDIKSLYDYDGDKFVGSNLHYVDYSYKPL